MKGNLIKIIFISIVTSIFILSACSANPESESETASNQVEENSESSNDNGGQTGEVKDELEIVWIHMQSAAQSEQRAKEGFEQFVEENGYNWNISYLDSKGSGQNVASNIEDAVQRGVDAIITSMTD